MQTTYKDLKPVLPMRLPSSYSAFADYLQGFETRSRRTRAGRPRPRLQTTYKDLKLASRSAPDAFEETDAFADYLQGFETSPTRRETSIRATEFADYLQGFETVMPSSAILRRSGLQTTYKDLKRARWHSSPATSRIVCRLPTRI